MPVEMIGCVAPRVSSELIPASGPPFDATVIAETARIHECAGFDRVLIGYFSDAPDGFLVGAHAAAVTERLGFLLVHRPGFVAPPRWEPELHRVEGAALQGPPISRCSRSKLASWANLVTPRAWPPVTGSRVASDAQCREASGERTRDVAPNARGDRSVCARELRKFGR